jgi:hypothetical protein
MEPGVEILEKTGTRCTCNLRAVAQHQLQHSSPLAQITPIASLELNAAAACRVFGPRSARAQYLQPPAQLLPPGFTLSQRSLDRASMQSWCRDNTQRAQLLCCSCSLSTLASRLARAVYRRQVNRCVEIRVVACIMRRFFSGYALRRGIAVFGHELSPVEFEDIIPAKRPKHSVCDGVCAQQ